MHRFHSYDSSIFVFPAFVFISFLAEVKMPSGKIDLPIIEDNHDGTVRIQYDPTEEGVHELVLTHNGIPVQGN